MSYQEVRRKVLDCARKEGRNPSDITIVTVTKTHLASEIAEVFREGCRDFGENRVQEALEKIPQISPHARWHFIGTLQKNKVRKAIGRFSLIHSVDSFDLAQRISEASLESGLVTDILLQANTSAEATKHGLSGDEWKCCFEKLLELSGIAIKGLMTMAPLTDDQECIRHCFRDLRLLRADLVKQAGDRAFLSHLSMGMSHDYPIAIAEGATILRIGTAIFDHLQP